MHLEVTLKSGRVARVQVPEGSSLNDLLNDFMNQGGSFESDWISVGTDAEPELVRYTEIVSVKPVLA